MSAIDDFIATYGSLANNVAAQTGLSQSEILGQWGLETAWGSHFAGQNNLGNVSPGGVVANYATPQEGAMAYVQALQHENINTQSLGSDPAAFANALQNQGYATDPNYAAKLQSTIDSAQNYGASSDSNSTDGLQPDGSYKVTIAGTSQTPASATTGTSGGSSTSGTGIGFDFGLGWIESKLGDIGLIIFGLIVIAGVVLISQKKTIVNITKDVTK